MSFEVPATRRPKADAARCEYERKIRSAAKAGDRTGLVRSLYVLHYAIVRDTCDGCDARIRVGQMIAYDAPDVICLDCWRAMPAGD